MVKKNVEAERLHFSAGFITVLNNMDVVFSAVGTLPDEDGSADLNYVLQVVKTICQNMKRYVFFVTKSTVSVGTAKKVKETIMAEISTRKVSIDFDVAIINSDALSLVTEWKEFRIPSWAVVKKTMKNPLIIDGRNIYDWKELTETGFEYYA